MRKLSKVLSILLAMLLVFSTASIGVEAKYAAYKDVDMTYDAIDQPILSLDQYASMAMDELDRMLMKENITFKEEFMGFGIEANFSTIDNALDSISGVYTQFKGMLNRIGGDIANMDFSALVNKDTGALVCPKRDTDGASDMDIFRAVFQFLADNAAIIAKVPKGSKSDTNPDGLDLGLVGGFVDLGEKLNVPKMVKEIVCKYVWPEKDKSEYDLNATLDSYVQTMITRVLDGTYPTNVSKMINRISEVAQDYLPGLSSQIDFMNAPVYDVIEQGVRAVLDSDKAMAFINYTVQRWLHQFCGYAYTKSTAADGTPVWTPDHKNDNINEQYVAMVNLDFTLTSFNTASWGNTTFVDHLNDILGKIVKAAFKPSTGITWVDGGNDKLFANIRSAVEVVLEYTGSGLFADYVEVVSIEDVRRMTDDQFVAYILRSIMNASISSVFIDSSVNTTVGVLFETVRSLAGDVVPSQDYSGMTASVDNLVKIGLDIAAAGLKGVTSMDIPFGLDDEEFVEMAMEWVLEKYGGFISGYDGTGWEAASSIFFNIIPSNWLPYKADGSLRDSLDDILFTDIIENLEVFDLPAILALASKNPNGELNNSIVEVLLARLTEIVNYVIPGTFPGEYTTLESLLVPANLGDIIEGLLNGLNDRLDDLAPALLPIACSALDLSTPEEFGYPYVSLEDNKLFNPSLEDTFYMYNGSSGINTAYTDKAGNGPHRDKLYEYKINSITVDNDDVTVLTDLDTSPVGTIIKGGNTQIFKFDGIDAAMDSLLTVTIAYDVYGETGQKMTTSPLTTTNYVYVSETVDDGSEEEKTPVSGNMHVLLYKKGVYMSSPAKVADLADLSVTIRRNVSKVSSQHTRPTTASVTAVTLDSKLTARGVSGNTSWSVNTTKDGGSFDFKPYVVAANNTAELPVGKYKNTLELKAGGTNNTTDVSWTKDQTIFVYEDFGASSYLRSAVRSDRQAASYGTGDFEATYIPFDSLELVPTEGTKEEIEAAKAELMETVDVNGADAWERYTEAVRVAAEVLYAPRSVNSFLEVSGQFNDLARELYEATQELEACSVSSGAAGVQSALNALIPDDTEVVLDEDGNVKYDEDGNEIRSSVPYYDPAHTFFAREDFVSYTYTRFKPERRAAERLINRWKDGLNGKDVEPISAVEAAYATHRLNLYGSRLIRVRAYKEHLDAAITRFTALHNAGKGSWSTESWDNFDTAYNFALTVNAEPIGTTYSGSENLKTEGLRQSKVNAARDNLIKTAKRLVEATTDFAALRQLVNDNATLYASGGSGYTPASWAAFSSAYVAAQNVLNNAAATQDDVDGAFETLTQKIAQLESASQSEPVTFEENEDYEGVLPSVFTANEDASENFESENMFLIGLSEDMIGDLESFVNVGSGYTIEIIGNESNDEESTGAQLVVKKNGSVVATYLLVLYGEVTGEGEISPYDTVTILGAANFIGDVDWEEFESIDEFAESMAADVNHDGEITAADAAEMIAVTRGKQTINQNWCSDDDALFFYA